MNYLDNIEEELLKIAQVRESQNRFKKTKLKNLLDIKPKVNNQSVHVRLPKSFYDKVKKQNKLTRGQKRSAKRAERKYKNRVPRKYDVYIKSDWWAKRKNLYYKTHKRICSACDSAEYIDLHHLVYGSFGKEKDENLTPLCRSCHDEFHSLNGVKGDMYKETLQFIKDKKHPK